MISRALSRGHRATLPHPSATSVAGDGHAIEGPGGGRAHSSHPGPSDRSALSMSGPAARQCPGDRGPLEPRSSARKALDAQCRGGGWLPYARLPPA